MKIPKSLQNILCPTNYDKIKKNCLYIWNINGNFRFSAFSFGSTTTGLISYTDRSHRLVTISISVQSFAPSWFLFYLHLWDEIVSQHRLPNGSRKPNEMLEKKDKKNIPQNVYCGSPFSLTWQMSPMKCAWQAFSWRDIRIMHG